MEEKSRKKRFAAALLIAGLILTGVPYAVRAAETASTADPGTSAPGELVPGESGEQPPGEQEEAAEENEQRLAEEDESLLDDDDRDLPPGENPGLDLPAEENPGGDVGEDPAAGTNEETDAVEEVPDRDDPGEEDPQYEGENPESGSKGSSSGKRRKLPDPTDVPGYRIPKLFDPARAASSTPGTWIRRKGRRGFRYRSGRMAVGSRKISGRYYVFDKKGRLVQPKKKALCKVDGATYYVGKSGLAISGWHVVKNKLYYADKKGRIQKKRTIQGIRLRKDGSAAPGKRTNWQKTVSRTVDKLTTVRMTREQKLRACWKYLSNRHYFHFRYQREPNMRSKTWIRKRAAEFLKYRSGDCTSFAAGFCAMAHTIGYQDVKLVYALVDRPRRSGLKGYRQHSWVQIRGRHFDPEACWSRWLKNCYGRKQYPYSYRAGYVVKYSTGNAKKR